MRSPISSVITLRRAYPGPVMMRSVLLALVVTSISCSALSRRVVATNPLLGRWREIAWVDCRSGQEQVTDDPIRELMFHPDGAVTVTWHPIETYVDYKGTYELSEAGAMKIVITWSAYAPGDFDGDGSYQIDNGGNLLLADMWLGSPKQTQGLNGCGHRFQKVE
jgi:hypothetical protein